MSTHQEVPFYKLNAGKFYECPEVPLPPRDGMPLSINDYTDIKDEVKFDPEIHLDLKTPEFVSKFPDFHYCYNFEEDRKIVEETDSNFAFSAPFQVTSVGHPTLVPSLSIHRVSNTRPPKVFCDL
jgi:hypothetical protein